MALEFDEQLSRLEKPNRNEMTNKEYAVFNENVETMEKNWGFINNLFKVLPLNASQYIGFLDFKGSLLPHQRGQRDDRRGSLLHQLLLLLPDHPRRCAAGLYQESHVGG